MVEDFVLHVVEPAKVLPAYLRLHDIDRVGDLLGLLLFRVELHVPRSDRKVLDGCGDSWTVETQRTLRFSQLLS